MPRYHFRLIEPTISIDDLEGQEFADLAAATRDARRQIRNMLAVEMVENGKIDLRRSIEILAGPGGTHRIAFANAVSLRV
jgi:hypothetical protein